MTHEIGENSFNSRLVSLNLFHSLSHSLSFCFSISPSFLFLFLLLFYPFSLLLAPQNIKTLMHSLSITLSLSILSLAVLPLLSSVPFLPYQSHPVPSPHSLSSLSLYLSLCLSIFLPLTLPLYISFRTKSFSLTLFQYSSLPAIFPSLLLFHAFFPSFIAFRLLLQSNSCLLTHSFSFSLFFMLGYTIITHNKIAFIHQK